MSKDDYSADDRVKSPWMKWNKVGDHIFGTLTSVSEREQTSLEGKVTTEKVYELRTDGGEFHDAEKDEEGNTIVMKEATPIKEGETWNVGGHFTYNSSMKNIKIGQKIKIEFIESKPSKTKGNANMKVRAVFSKGVMDTPFLEELDERKREEAVNNF
jgi:hypothetical protein